MVREAVPETPLPEVSSNQSPEAHTQMSVRFQEHTVLEKAKGNRLQTSEKIWGSVAQAINAIGKRRGWKTDTHDAMQDVVIQLGAELDSHLHIPRKSRFRAKKEFNDWFSAAEGMHRNFYRNNKHQDAINLAEASANGLVSRLTDMRDKQPMSFEPKDDDDLRRLGRLLDIKDPDTGNRARIEYLRQVIPVGVADPNGFSPNFGYRKPGEPDDNDDGSGGGVPNPDDPPDGGQGGGELQAPTNGGLNLQRRENPDPPDKPAKPMASSSNSRAKRQEPKAPAQCKVATGPGKERRRVIAPRPAARR